MRAFRLIALAAQAEGMLLRRQGATLGRTAVLGFSAAAFGLAALSFLHVAAWIWLEDRVSTLGAALIIALADMVIMGLLLLMARDRPDPVAEEAQRLRDQSLSLLASPSSSGGADWQRLAMEAIGVLAERWLRK